MLALGLLVVIGMSVVSVERIPPDTLTRSRMMWAEANIRKHVHVHNCLPISLSELPKQGLVDGWKRPIQYEREGWTVTLSSFGRDGDAGGTGQDADLFMTFTIDQKQGANPFPKNKNR